MLITRLSAALVILWLGLVSCTTPAGWTVRFSEGVYHFDGGKYSIKSPIPTSMCLDIKEFDHPRQKGARFRECHGYIQAVYTASLITATQELNDNSFVDITINKQIPNYLNQIFQPFARAELLSKEIGTINGRKAVFFSGTAVIPDGKSRVLGVFVLLDPETVLSATVSSLLEEKKFKYGMNSSPEAVEKEFKKFIESIRRAGQPLTNNAKTS